MSFPGRFLTRLGVLGALGVWSLMTVSPVQADDASSGSAQDSASSELAALHEAPWDQRGDFILSPKASLEALSELPADAPAAQSWSEGGSRTGWFGEAWTDVDGDGCDTRNEILARDLADADYSRADGVQSREQGRGQGAGVCPDATVWAGTLQDPYTGRRIAFNRGQDTSAAVQIDHVVPLNYLYAHGAWQWDERTRLLVANDPLNLIAVDDGGLKGLPLTGVKWPRPDRVGPHLLGDLPGAAHAQLDGAEDREVGLLAGAVEQQRAIAVGLDPEKTTIFPHSAVPALNQLMLPFLSLVTDAELRRNPTVKAEFEATGNRPMSGLLLTYPVHQAADILFCKANIVPVGKDQLPHLEQTRVVADRFETRYGHPDGADGPVFPRPQGLLSEAETVLGLDGAKMSKSRGNTIELRMSADQTAKLIRKAVTDSDRRIAFDPANRPEVSNLVLLAAMALFLTGALSFVGAAYLSGALSDVEYFLEVNIFRGIKLTFVLPILLVAIAFLERFSVFGDAAEGFTAQGCRLLAMPVTVKTLAVFVGILVAGVVLLARSGHSMGMPVSGLELRFRAFLEQALYARPRSKELLIGHPAFMMAALAWFKKWPGMVLFLLVLAANIGQGSMVETFAHMRTPVMMSFARGIGGLIGTQLPINTDGIAFAMTALFVVIFIEQWLNDPQHYTGILGLAAAGIALAVFGRDAFMLPTMFIILAGCLALRPCIERRETA